MNFPALWLCLLIAIASAAHGESRVVQLGADPQAKAEVWLESSLARVYPDTKPGRAELELLVPRNGRVAFQICARSEKIQVLHVEPKLIGADDFKSKMRFEGLVPVQNFSANLSEVEGLGEIPGMVPDPLLPNTKVNFGPYQSRAFWVTLNIPATATPGPRKITVRVALHTGEKGSKTTVVELPLKLTVSRFVIQPRHDFPVTHWWRGEATWDYYKTGMFDQRWWNITRDQLTDMLDHGSDVVYVPIFFDRRETFQRPCQLLVVNEPTPGKYEFDFSKVKQFTDMARQIGFKQFEWSHLWIYWGVKNPIRVYTEKPPGKFEMLWSPDISGFSDTYVGFLKQLLPAFHNFLEQEKLLESSYFHLSDEPHANDIERYRQARKILHDLAPWMKTMDALSDVSYGREGVTDIPVPVISGAQAFIDAGIPHWVYYCCSPTGDWLNRFEDTPLPKIRMSGWIFYRLGAKGFLHWGFNYWHKLEREEITDPFCDTTGGGVVPAGDPFEIYPGKDGAPIDSIRWEVFAESLQDYAILQTAGVTPNDPMLADIKSYKDFPKTQEWIRSATQKLLGEPRVAAQSPRQK
ncbi:MAG: DUF4091 domain-containing protein [Limisphaerales bacterium]